MQSEAKVHVPGNMYRHNPYTHYIGKTHLISQRLSLNMPRLNQNQQIQALTMLARFDNVSNIRREFGCHRNTIIRLCQHIQQTGGVADRRKLSRTDRFDVVFKWQHILQGSMVSANRQCCTASCCWQCSLLKMICKR